MIFGNGAERKQWLAGLKPGDQVAVPCSSYEGRDYRILRIKYITPSRNRFDLETGDGQVSKYGADGYAQGQSGYGRARFQELTQEIREVLQHRRAWQRLERLVMDKNSRRVRMDLTLDQMTRIILVLEEVNASAPT
jgi:hypothetical protein